jgi:hypothetical protein
VKKRRMGWEEKSSFIFWFVWVGSVELLKL